MELSPHTTLQNGKYKILSKLGQGGFGITYIAETKARITGTTGSGYDMTIQVVIKEFFLKEDCARAANSTHVSVSTTRGKELFDIFKNKLKKEGKILASLDHPHITKVTDIFEENNTAYIVMRYIKGQNLEELQKAQGDKPLPLAKVMRYIGHISSALATVHKNDILHLDIKPSNILIEEATDEAMLIDFGISKSYTKSGEATSFSPAAISAGYSAIEQTYEEGIRHFSPATDIHALGCTMYKLLTGIRPADIQSRSLKEISEASELIRTIPPALSKVIAKSMQYHYDKRHQNIPSLLTDLKPFLDETQIIISPPPPSPPSPPRPPVQSSSSLPIRLLAGIAGFLLMVGMGWYFWGSFRGGNPTPSVEASKYITQGDAFYGARAYSEAKAKYEKALDILPSDTSLARKIKSCDSLINLPTNEASTTPTTSTNTPVANTDPCKHINCGAHGTCKEGRCECKDGYTGPYCATSPVQQPTNTVVATRVSSSDPFAGQMVYVQGGTFTMGCIPEQGNDCYGDEKPAHDVTVSGFSISKHEVTLQQWREVMGNNPSDHRNCDDCPVENVSWDDIQDFLKKLKARTGKNYRLPTEAEWEFAARGGTKSRGYKYSGGNDLGAVGWYKDNSGDETHPVGKKTANELGLYDMSGNVCEWCSDWYGEDYYFNSPTSNPRGPSSGSYRVSRGRSCFDYPLAFRVASRGAFSPSNSGMNVGFRVISQ